MGKGKSVVNYTEAKELRLIAEQLKVKYYTVVGYIDLEKIYFAFKGGDLPEWFECEVLGLQDTWIQHSVVSMEETKLYCVAMTYDFYTKISGPLLEWTMLDLLYSCAPKMNGKKRGKDVHEHSRILSTIEDLGEPLGWRGNIHLPALLGEETILFGMEEEEENDDDYEDY